MSFLGQNLLHMLIGRSGGWGTWEHDPPVVCTGTTCECGKGGY